MYENRLAAVLFFLQFVVLLSYGQNVNLGKVKNSGGVLEYNSWTNGYDSEYLGSDYGIFIHTQKFHNDGRYNCEYGHRDIFEGPTIEISGERRPAFFWVDFKSDSGLISISNSEGISVKGFVDFQNGITKTNRATHISGGIRFEDNASYQGGMSDDQHVDGYVAKIGDDPFIFPVGSGSFSWAISMSAPVNVDAYVGTAWVEGDPTIKQTSSDGEYHPITSVSQGFGVLSLGQWDWVTIVPPANDLALTTTISNHPSHIPLKNLRLMGWNGSIWINLSGQNTATESSEGATVTGFLPSGSTITAISLGFISNDALPVVLEHFSATYSDDSCVLVEWKTASEQNSDFFEIGYSTDGQNFKAIGTVKSLNEFGTTSNYSFKHSPPTSIQTIYYRLKMYDLDGTFALSKIDALSGRNAGLAIFPNPVSVSEKLQISNRTNVKKYTITSMNGCQITAAGSIPEGGIAISHLLPGVYILRLEYLDFSTSNFPFIALP